MYHAFLYISLPSMTERISSASSPPPPPLILDQNEAQGAEKMFFETPHPTPLTESLDPPLRIGVKLLNFTFFGGRKHKDNDFLFLFLNFDTVLKIQLQKSFLTFDVLNEME